MDGPLDPFLLKFHGFVRNLVVQRMNSDPYERNHRQSLRAFT